ncbi:MAG: hypothetical protein M0C28_01135 [Candidatus Moduliflexus flocculans]|nr:hypothetical protein [Candidatus Moduliflexus flocculans]
MIGLVTMQNVSQDRARKLRVYLPVAFRIGAEPERCGYRRNRFRVFYRGYAEEFILVFGNGLADYLAVDAFLLIASKQLISLPIITPSGGEINEKP